MEPTARGEERWVLLVCVGASLLAIAAPARAQESAPPDAMEEERPEPQPAAGDVARAREHFDVALTLYRTGRFREAAVEFQQAYSLSGAPELLHNLYLAYRDSGDLAAAAVSLRQYLAVEHDIADEQRAILEHRLEALEAATTSDEGDEGSGEGERPTQDEEPPREPEPARPEPVSADPPWGAIGSFSIGGLGAILLAVTGPLALTERDALAAECAPRCTDAQIDGVRTLGILADVGLGVAAAGALVGVILLAVGEGSSREPDRSEPEGSEAGVRVAPLVSSTFAGAVIEGRL